MKVRISLLLALVGLLLSGFTPEPDPDRPDEALIPVQDSGYWRNFPPPIFPALVWLDDSRVFFVGARREEGVNLREHPGHGMHLWNIATGEVRWLGAVGSVHSGGEACFWDDHVYFTDVIEDASGNPRLKQLRYVRVNLSQERLQSRELPEKELLHAYTPKDGLRRNHILPVPRWSG